MELIINNISITQIESSSISLNSKEGRRISLPIKIKDNTEARSALIPSQYARSAANSFPAIVRAGQIELRGTLSISKFVKGVHWEGVFLSNATSVFDSESTLLDLVNFGVISFKNWRYIKDLYGVSVGAIKDSDGAAIIPLATSFNGSEVKGEYGEGGDVAALFSSPVPTIIANSASVSELTPYVSVQQLFSWFNAYATKCFGETFTYDQSWSAWNLLKTASFGLYKPTGNTYLTKPVFSFAATPGMPALCHVAFSGTPASFSQVVTFNTGLKITDTELCFHYLFSSQNASWPAYDMAPTFQFVGYDDDGEEVFTSDVFGVYCEVAVDGTGVFVKNTPQSYLPITATLQGTSIYQSGEFSTLILTTESGATSYNVIICFTSTAAGYKTTISGDLDFAFGYFNVAGLYRNSGDKITKSQDYSLSELLGENKIADIIKKIINAGGGTVVRGEIGDAELLMETACLDDVISAEYSHSEIGLFNYTAESFSTGTLYSTGGEITKELPRFGFDVDIKGNVNNTMPYNAYGASNNQLLYGAALPYQAYIDGVSLMVISSGDKIEITETFGTMSVANLSETRLCTNSETGAGGGLFYIAPGGAYDICPIFETLGVYCAGCEDLKDLSKPVQREGRATPYIGSSLYLGMQKETNYSTTDAKAGWLSAPTLLEKYFSLYHTKAAAVSAFFNAVSLKIESSKFFWAPEFENTLICYDKALWYPVCYKNYNPEGSGNVELYYRRVC